MRRDPLSPSLSRYAIEECWFEMSPVGKGVPVRILRPGIRTLSTFAQLSSHRRMFSIHQVFNE